MDSIFGVPQKRIKHLLKDLERGIPPTNLTQDESDALHYEITEANLAYWKEERAKAREGDDDRRMKRCDEGCRIMLLTLTPHSNEDSPLLDGIGAILAEIDHIPGVHRD